MTNSIRSKEREARLREFWPTSMPLRVLAEEWLCTTACISVWAKALGLPSREGRKYEIRGAGNHIPVGENYMVTQAELRGISVGELERRILLAIIDGRLVNAVLDDVDETKKAA